MTGSIGPKGYINLQATPVGARRQVKVVSVVGVAAAGPVVLPQGFAAANKMGLRAVIDVQDGKNRTTEFSDTGSQIASTSNGLHLTQLDTGPSGHTCWAIFTDTGT